MIDIVFLDVILINKLLGDEVEVIEILENSNYVILVWVIVKYSIVKKYGF